MSIIILLKISTHYAKCSQKLLFRERAKSDYFRSASSDRDNKWVFVLGLGTRFLLALLLVSSILKS